MIQPVYSDTSSNHATVLATNKVNATAQNWKVRYADNTDIPATSGTYVCQANTSCYITLTVKKDSAIKLNFQAAADGTPVRIVSGSNTQDITVGTVWEGTTYYTAGSSTMTVYGNIIGFNCRDNRANLTAIDVSKNKRLTILYCWDNELSSLNVRGCTQLTTLNCSSNTLTTLDVSGCTELKELYCYSNNLSSLNVRGCTQLARLRCYKNNFTTAALDDIYCALPDMPSDYASISPLYKSSSAAEQAIVKATNAANATAKNWRVTTYKEDGNHTDIATTGTYDCSTAVAEATAEPALSLYPNPVADVLYISSTARTIRVYNIYGIEVAHAADTDRVEVSHLPAGIYTVRADGTVAKMVKR